MLVEVSLFVAALLLGLVAAVLGRAKPPALDPGRLLAVCQSALLWGLHDQDQGEGAVAAWTERVGAALLYSPAGREGWAKLDHPDRYEIPVPSVSGERALVEALQGLEPGKPRFERLFADDSARAALLDDPHGLGEDYDPARWLGHGCDWESLARWGEPVQAAIGRRLEHHHLVVLAAADTLDAARELHRSLSAEVSAVLVPVDPVSCNAEAGEALAAQLRQLAREPADRLVLLALGDVGPFMLEAMVADPELRDRVVAVVFDGCPLGGVPEPAPEGLSVAEREAWLGEHFNHPALDTELRRSTPYCTLARLAPDASPSGDGRVPWARQRLDEPPAIASGRRPVAMVDLGAAPADRGLLEPLVVGRSFVLLLAFLLGEGAPRP